MEKFLQHLAEAEKDLRTVDHIVYVTFPLIKDKRLLLKVIQEIRNIMINCITSILQYEYLFKRVNLYNSSKENFDVFTEKCAPMYDINKNEIRDILHILDLVEKHKESPFEFVRGDKIIMLSDSLKPTTLTLDKIKEFLNLAKDILRKTKEKMKKDHH